MQGDAVALGNPRGVSRENSTKELRSTSNNDLNVTNEDPYVLATR